jgi:hypothetical protein
MYSGGDFYLSGLRFIANNIGQRGLQSLGDIGSVPLATVTIPAGGYSIFGADAVLWHTYVSLAQSGEEGNHIVFRVQEIVGDSVLIDYLYVTE